MIENKNTALLEQDKDFRRQQYQRAHHRRQDHGTRGEYDLPRLHDSRPDIDEASDIDERLNKMSRSELEALADMIIEDASADRESLDIQDLMAEIEAAEESSAERELGEQETTLRVGSFALDYATTDELADEFNRRLKQGRRRPYDVHRHYQGHGGDDEALDVSPLDGFSIKSRP